MVNVNEEITMTERDQEHEKWVAEHVGHEFTWWGEANPGATLGDLLKFLAGAWEDCQNLESSTNDGNLNEHTDDMSSELVDYLNAFGEQEDDETFSYRETGIEEDHEYVEELIGIVGVNVKIADLPQRSTAASLPASAFFIGEYGDECILRSFTSPSLKTCSLFVFGSQDDAIAWAHETNTKCRILFNPDSESNHLDLLKDAKQSGFETVSIWSRVGVFGFIEAASPIEEYLE